MSDDAPPADNPTASPAPRQKKKLVSLGGLCESVAALSLGGTWLGSLGRYHWVCDLASHFRLQYLVVCVLALLFALLRRSTWLVVLALLSGLWNLQIIHDFHQTATAPAAPEGRPLRVMSFNVLTNNSNQVAAINHVLQADADIVCLLEVDVTWHAALEPLRVKYAHRVEELTEGNFGIACYTRLPTKSLQARRFGPLLLPTLVLNLDHMGRPLTFIGTHPIPPMGAHNAHAWRDQLSGIAALVADLQSEVIVAGDFNATPWCEGMRQLREGGGLDFHSIDPVWVPTWGRKLPMMIPIDHVLVKGGLTIQKRTIGPDVGSDHRSVTVEIVR